MKQLSPCCARVMMIGSDGKELVCSCCKQRFDVFPIEEIQGAGLKNSISALPADSQERKKYPIASGVLDYFPDALVEIARVSYEGNQQHNPGEPLHWARGKSTDQDDTIIRHFLERGKRDVDGMRHSAKLAWRALALLQLEIEAEGAPMARGAKP